MGTREDGLLWSFYLCVFKLHCTVSTGLCVGAVLCQEDAQEPSSPIPPLTHTHTEALSPTALLRCIRKFGNGIKARDPSADGSVHRGKADFTGTLPPCPSQALRNLAVGEAGLTTL